MEVKKNYWAYFRRERIRHRLKFHHYHTKYLYKVTPFKITTFQNVNTFKERLSQSKTYNSLLPERKGRCYGRSDKKVQLQADLSRQKSWCNN